MIRHLRQNTVAYLALVVACSTGTAYAVERIADGSVTTKALAKNAVTSPKIKRNAVKSSDVKDGAVTGADLADGSVGATDVQDGSLTVADLAPGTLPGTDGVWAATLNASDPVAGPEQPGLDSFSFTLPRPGNVYIAYHVAYFNATCAGNDADVGLYADGMPLPRTRVSVPPVGEPRQALNLARVQALAAGVHTVTVGVNCATGALGSVARFDRSWTVLLVSE